MGGRGLLNRKSGGEVSGVWCVVCVVVACRQTGSVYLERRAGVWSGDGCVWSVRWWAGSEMGSQRQRTDGGVFGRLGLTCKKE